MHNGAEIVEKFGELAVILLLGSMLTLDGLGTPGWAGWGLALLVVFVLRPLTVNLALLGSRLQRPGERAFLAWFGVRGVGTLFYVAARHAGSARCSGEEARADHLDRDRRRDRLGRPPRRHRRPAEPLAPGQRARPGLGGDLLDAGRGRALVDQVEDGLLERAAGGSRARLVGSSAASSSAGRMISPPS